MARPYFAFTDEQEDLILDMYIQGHSLNSIRDAIGGICSHMTIKNLLITAKIYKPGGYGIRTITCKACGQQAASKRKVLCETCIPDKTAWQRYKLYGITQPEFDMKLMEQNGLCDLCGKPFSGEADMRLDHCHDQGHNRGILHHRCNVGLSYVEDREFVGMAVRYAEKHRR